MLFIAVGTITAEAVSLRARVMVVAMGNDSFGLSVMQNPLACLGRLYALAVAESSHNRVPVVFFFVSYCV